MATLAQPQAVRRSMRQLIAMTHGIVRTTSDSSGTASDTTTDASNDRVSNRDIAAMTLLSGCRQAVPAVSAVSAVSALSTPQG